MNTFDNDQMPSWPTPREIVAIPFRQRWVILLAFVLCLLGAVALSFSTPKYQAHMKILVQRQRAQAVITSSASVPGTPTSDQVSEEDLNSEVELLNSEDLLRTVVLTTDLGKDLESQPGQRREKQIARAVRKLGKDLAVVPLRKSDVISVQYTNTNPETAAKVLRTLAAAYTKKHLELNQSTGEFQFFDQQMEQSRHGLQEAQAQLVKFTKETGIISADTEEESALQKATDFDLAARQAQVEARSAQGRLQELNNTLQTVAPRVATAERTGDNPQLLTLKSTLLALQLKREELLTKYQPTYRLVEEIDREIADARSAIARETSAPIQDRTTDQNPEYRLVREEMIRSQADLDGMNARASAANADATIYRHKASDLQRNHILQDDLLQQERLQQDNYLLYAKKREQAHIDQALDQRGILNVALAEAPIVPALPTQSPLYLSVLVALFGIPLSLAIGFIADVLDTSLNTPDKAAAYLGIPVLAAFPEEALV